MNCCEKCKVRKWFASCFDVHFYGSDCPYKCEKFEQEKALKERESNG